MYTGISEAIAADRMKEMRAQAAKQSLARQARRDRRAQRQQQAQRHQQPQHHREAGHDVAAPQHRRTGLRQLFAYRT